MSLSERFIEEIRGEFPRFRIVPKEGNGLSRAIDVGLRVVTLGGQSAYLTRYHTVIGDTLYVPPSWDSMSDVDRVILLRHERVHLRQRRRYGFLGMALLYLLPVFPLGLAYFRARMEWEAYVETLRATAEHYGVEAVKDGPLREHLVGRFTGPDYGWMWPFPRTIRKWYDEAVRTIERSAA
ncbi:MAG TPA: hypothetical protein VHE30_05445 [Polyangiaceae bacterium]|nr:hypothetical protein [Polyangiaceae bacterium]